MTLKTAKAAVLISAALMFAAPAFGRQGDILKRADNKSNVASAQTNTDSKSKIFGKIMPLRQEPGGSGNAPKSITDVYWECIPSKETETPAPKETGVPKKY